MRKTKITINKQNLLNNLNIIRKTSNNKQIIPLIKSNAYGHGQIEIAKILQNENVYAFGIAYTNEAVYLRENGINHRLFISVPITINDANEVVELDLIPTIDNLEVLIALNNLAKSNNKIIDFHLFVNSGMNRDGANEKELIEIANYLFNLKNVNLIATLSHLASSDNIEYSQTQIKEFLRLNKAAKLEQYKKHISNSGGIFNLDNSEFDFVRPGISLYGILPDKNKADNIGLKAVMELKTSIKSIYELAEGDYAGYSFKFQAKKNTKVAILPIGYGDGYSYLYSNNSKCIINDKFSNIIGSVCMDIIICDVTDIDCKIGDEVILIGKSENKEISVNDLASYINTNPYEISTSLKRRIKREIV